MPWNSTEQRGDFAAAVPEQKDSETITALIEQLNRDLEETQNSASNGH